MAKTRAKPAVKVAVRRPKGTAKIKWRPERPWKKLVVRAVPDDLRDEVKSRVKALEITIVELAKACDHAPSRSAIERYLWGKTAMNSHHLHTLLKKLGWTGKIPWRGHF